MKCKKYFFFSVPKSHRKFFSLNFLLAESCSPKNKVLTPRRTRIISIGKEKDISVSSYYKPISTIIQICDYD